MNSNKKKIIIIVAVIAILVLGIGGYLIHSSHSQPAKPTQKRSTSLVGGSRKSRKPSNSDSQNDANSSSSQPNKPSNQSKQKSGGHMVPKAKQGFYLSSYINPRLPMLQEDSGLFINGNTLNIQDGCHVNKKTGALDHVKPNKMRMLKTKILPVAEKAAKSARAVFDIKNCKTGPNNTLILTGNYESGGRTTMRVANQHKIVLQFNNNSVSADAQSAIKDNRKGAMVGRGLKLAGRKISPTALNFKKHSRNVVMSEIVSIDHAGA